MPPNRAAPAPMASQPPESPGRARQLFATLQEFDGLCEGMAARLGPKIDKVQNACSELEAGTAKLSKLTAQLDVEALPGADYMKAEQKWRKVAQNTKTELGHQIPEAVLDNTRPMSNGEFETVLTIFAHSGKLDYVRNSKPEWKQLLFNREAVRLKREHWDVIKKINDKHKEDMEKLKATHKIEVEALLKASTNTAAAENKILAARNEIKTVNGKLMAFEQGEEDRARVLADLRADLQSTRAERDALLVSQKKSKHKLTILFCLIIHKKDVSKSVVDEGFAIGDKTAERYEFEDALNEIRYLRREGAKLEAIAVKYREESPKWVGFDEKRKEWGALYHLFMMASRGEELSDSKMDWLDKIGPKTYLITIKRIQKTVLDLKTRTAELATSKENLEAKISKLKKSDGRLVALRESSDKLKADYNDLKAVCNANVVTIRRLNNDVLKLNNTVTEKNEMIGEYRLKVIDLRSAEFTVGYRDGEIAMLQKDIEANEGTLKKVKDVGVTLLEHQTKLSEKYRTKSKIQELFWRWYRKTALGKMKQMSARIVKLRGTISQGKTMLAQNERYITNLGRDAGDFKDMIFDLDEQVTEWKSAARKIGATAELFREAVRQRQVLQAKAHADALAENERVILALQTLNKSKRLQLGALRMQLFKQVTLDSLWVRKQLATQQHNSRQELDRITRIHRKTARETAKDQRGRLKLTRLLAQVRLEKVDELEGDLRRVRAEKATMRDQREKLLDQRQEHFTEQNNLLRRIGSSNRKVRDQQIAIDNLDTNLTRKQESMDAIVRHSQRLQTQVTNMKEEKSILTAQHLTDLENTRNSTAHQVRVYLTELMAEDLAALKDECSREANAVRIQHAVAIQELKRQHNSTTQTNTLNHWKSIQTVKQAHSHAMKLKSVQIKGMWKSIDVRDAQIERLLTRLASSREMTVRFVAALLAKDQDYHTAIEGMWKSIGVREAQNERLLNRLAQSCQMSGKLSTALFEKDAKYRIATAQIKSMHRSIDVRDARIGRLTANSEGGMFVLMKWNHDHISDMQDSISVRDARIDRLVQRGRYLNGAVIDFSSRIGSLSTQISEMWMSIAVRDARIQRMLTRLGDFNQISINFTTTLAVLKKDLAHSEKTLSTTASSMISLAQGDPVWTKISRILLSASSSIATVRYKPMTVSVGSGLIVEEQTSRSLAIRAVVLVHANPDTDMLLAIISKIHSQISTTTDSAVPKLLLLAVRKLVETVPRDTGSELCLGMFWKTLKLSSLRFPQSFKNELGLLEKSVNFLTAQFSRHVQYTIDILLSGKSALKPSNWRDESRLIVADIDGGYVIMIEDERVTVLDKNLFRKIGGYQENWHVVDSVGLRFITYDLDRIWWTVNIYTYQMVAKRGTEIDHLVRDFRAGVIKWGKVA